MARVIASQRFIEEAAGVWSARVRRELKGTLESIETFPKVGSGDIPDSIVEEFGNAILKMVVGSFDLFYEYEETSDIAYVHALVPQRQAR